MIRYQPRNIPTIAFATYKEQTLLMFKVFSREWKKLSSNDGLKK